MHHGTVDTETLEALRLLSNGIARGNVPSSKLDETLIIASWNIREFGKKHRTTKALHLVAEILGQFDLIALVELRENLDDLAEVLRYLGPYWKAVYSDSVNDPGGNWERLGFIYDERAVQFHGFAGNVHPKRKKVGAEYVYDKSFWRPPYMASFCSGNFDFVALSAHMRWGDDDKQRQAELERFATWVKERVKRKTLADTDIIVFGDFNTSDQDMIKALLKEGLEMPTVLKDAKTNSSETQHYDHILYLPDFTKAFTNRGGVLKA
jgi:endonuclease/exonuclease/phosphatase family metal-dependent hydrolase